MLLSNASKILDESRHKFMDLFLRTKKDLNNPLQEGLPAYFFGQGTNDLIIGPNKDFQVTSNTDNLVQSMTKILVTKSGANVLFKIYGTLLQSLVGQRLDLEYLRAKVANELINGLRIYQFINKDNSNLDEQIDTLDTIRITQDSSYSIKVQFTVITKSGKRIGTTIQLGNS